MLEVVETRHLGWTGYRVGRDVIRFIETCLMFGPNKPVKLFPWERRWILEVFREHEVVLFDENTGERRVETRRVISNSLVSIPRKNGKTGLISTLVPAFMFGPLYERGMEIVCAATKKDQAMVLFNAARDIMRSSPLIVEDGTFEFYRTSIFSETHGCKFQPVASREAGLHGLNCNVVLIDEIARMPDLKVYHTLEEALSARVNSMAISFSTMDERIDNPMTELMGQVEARRAAGIEADGWHVLDFKADLEADPDPLSDNNMLKANPSMPYIPALKEALEEARRAAMGSDYFLGRYMTTRLNIPGSSETQFVDPIKWKAAASPTGRSHLDEYPTNEPVVLGVDLSRSRDLTAIGMWFPDRKFLDCMCFLPEAQIAVREKRHNLPFRQFVNNGHVIACPGPIVDFDVVAEFLAKIAARFDILKMRYDTWGFENLRDALNRVEAYFPTEDVRMGVYSMDPFMIKFENMVEGGKLTHSNSPILNYCVHSIAAVEDKRSITGVRRPEKAYHNSLIDGGIAAMLAVGKSVKGERLTMDQIALDFDDD